MHGRTGAWLRLGSPIDAPPPNPIESRRLPPVETRHGLGRGRCTETNPSMNPTAMLALLVAALSAFVWSANRRWQLMKVGGPIDRVDHLLERLVGTWRYAFKQEKMDYYQPAGTAHKLIFVGLLLRSLIMWGRGFSPGFNFWWFGPTQALGPIYDFAKDVCAILVLAGVSVFFY